MIDPALGSLFSVGLALLFATAAFHKSRDLARFSPNQGPGDPYGGSHDLSQSYLLRPLPSQPSHRTAVPNVYLLGAATWPGHGVNGGSGYIVAQQLLKG